jgi:hypothetical protein
MKTTQKWMSAGMIAVSCLAGAAAAQDIDRRGPNVMRPPHSNGNYSNNTNTYENGSAQSRRGPNVMQTPEAVAEARGTPRTQRTPAPIDSETQTAPGAGERGGPNIMGEPQGFSPDAGGSAGRRGEASSPAVRCEKCVAI